MIDREHDLPLTRQATVLRISRGSVYYLPRPVLATDLELMRRLDRLHLEFPFAGSRMLRGLLVAEGARSAGVTSVRRYKSAGEGFHTWTEAEISQFQAKHPIGTRAGLALSLLLHTAQRRGDVVRMGWQHVRGDTIAVRQEKTDTPLLIQMHPVLALALNSVPRSNFTFLMTERGAPFTAAGFGNWFRKQCNLASLPQCSAHGLRKAAATRLANAGCSTNQIMAITGHKSLSQVAPYVRAADQHRLARQTMSIQLGSEQEQKLSNLPTRLDKRRSK